MRARQEVKTEALDTSLDNNPELCWKLLDILKKMDDVEYYDSIPISGSQWVKH